MSSSIFFKFKSQKEPTRLPFDGTAISVFDAKRDIIAIHKLGDGTDFDLAIYDAENNEEYVDDTVMIPRGTSITARRLPPVKPGRGTAQRYVTGKMPTAALSAGRIEKKAHVNHAAGGAKASGAPGSGVPGLNTEGQTEEERIAAMFQASSEQWNQTQEQMANARPIHGQGGFKKKNAPAPAHPPPNGYVCYRCGEKGHWIQQCPTNADPNFDGRPRVKRTTGIPKSFLKTVDKPIITDDDDGKPVSVMVNADGEYVVAEPDLASWELYQQKTKTAGLTGEAAAEAKLLEEKGLACPIDSKLFKDAVKTPCCKKTYCDDCIQNALVESDLVCPNCDTKEVLLDRLIPDTETRDKVKEYLDSKKTHVEEKEKEKSKSPTPSKAVTVKTEPGVKAEVGTPKLETAKTVENLSKKRAAEDDGTSMKRTASVASNDSNSKRFKPNSLSPVPNQVVPINGNSPAMQSAVPSMGNSGNANNNNNNMNFPQNNMMNGMSSNFDFNNNNNNNNMNGMMSGNNSNMGFNGMNGMMQNMNMGMNMGMNGMMQNNMGNNMGYNNNMGNMGNIGNMGNMNNMNMNMGMGMNNMGGNGMNGGYNNNNMMGYNNMSNGGYGMNNNMSNQGYYNNNNGYNNNNNGQFNQYGNNNMRGNMGMGQNMGQNMGYNNNMGQNMGGGMMNQNQGFNSNMGNNNNSNQRKIFSEPFPTDEDSPYMRKPVNPYRHMRPKRARPSDFTAVGGGIHD